MPRAVTSPRGFDQLPTQQPERNGVEQHRAVSRKANDATLGFEIEHLPEVNRKDFGLNWNAALETGGFLVGDEVKVSLSIQAA